MNQNDITLYIYTMGINNWTTTFDYFNSLLKNWNEYIIGNILKLIPEKYTRIDLLHGNTTPNNIDNKQLQIIKKYINCNACKYKPILKSAKFTRELLNFEKIEKQNHIIVDIGNIITYTRPNYVKLNNGIEYKLNVISGGNINSCTLFNQFNFTNLFSSKLFIFENDKIITFIDKLLEYKMMDSTSSNYVDYIIYNNCKPIYEMLNMRWTILTFGNNNCSLSLYVDFDKFENIIVNFYIDKLITSSSFILFNNAIKQFMLKINTFTEQDMEELLMNGIV
jgi:hypothetical protein